MQRFRLVRNVMGSGGRGLAFARVGDPRWLPGAVIDGNVLVGPGWARAIGRAEVPRPGRSGCSATWLPPE